MSGPRAYGLAWDEAEIDLAAWQGIVALRFAAVPPPGLAAELIVALAKPAAGLTPSDLALFAPDGGMLDYAVQPVADGDTELRVHFAQRGPRGSSRVRLDSGGSDPLHPFFAEASFDFFIDCPAGDCRAPATVDAAAAGAEPAIDLATKDFDGFAKVAQDWVRVTDPNWSDLTTASTEAMLIDVLAHAAEMLSLQQDRVAQEAFLDTARERLSLRRHASFVGLALDEGASASTIVAIDVATGVTGFLPSGSRMVRRDAGGRITASFVTRETVLLDARWNGQFADGSSAGALRPAAWPGAPDAALVVGATSLLLLDWGLGLLPGQRIALVQGAEAHVATITALDEIEAPGWTDDPAAPPGTALRQLTLVRWNAATTTRFTPWLEPVARPFRITANLAEAAHGNWRRAATTTATGVLPLGAGRRDAVFATDPATAERQLRALRTPESEVLVEADGGPALTLTIAGEPWLRQPDLANSASFDRHYTAEHDDDGAVWLVFGDGQQGRAIAVPPGTGAADAPNAVLPDIGLALTYRRGLAEEGNVGAFALNAALPPETDDAAAAADFAALGITAATNLVPGNGGRRGVSLDVARDLIPESIRHPPRERCVTAEDYARAAENVPGVAQAAAKPLGGLFNTIAVLCAPADGDALDADVAAAVHARLDALRMAGREHLVRPPDWVPLDIALLICPADGGIDPAAIRSAVRTALAPGTAARPGFFHRSRLGFGAEIRLADILASAAGASGVGAVRPLAFRPLFDAGGQDVRRAIRLAPTEIARFAADEARPQHGRLTVRIEGTDPPLPPGAFVVGGPAPEPPGAAP